jgi:hypothetical protein
MAKESRSSIPLRLTFLHTTVDFIAASFVRKAQDVKNLRQLLAENGGQEIKIICKIENQEGLENYTEVLQATDAIMVRISALSPIVGRSPLPSCVVSTFVVNSLSRQLFLVLLKQQVARGDLGMEVRSHRLQTIPVILSLFLTLLMAETRFLPPRSSWRRR